MAERRQLEFFVLRYVPDVVKGEFINFGIVAVENGPNGAELIDVRFTKDHSRILCLDPQADLDVFLKLQKELQEEIGRTKDRAVLLKRMEDSFSSLIQVSEVMPALTKDTATAEIGMVARMFLEAPKLRRTREPAGRLRILETMRDEFEKAGVLPLLNVVPAEPYTKAGDPFEFDFGYNTGTELKLFQAVSMRASVDSAVLLAARYPKIAERMGQLTGTAPMLTALVEEQLDKTRSEVAFAWEMMEESRIIVSRANDMGRIAEVARKELRV
jgi:hypothetical protein